MYVGTSKADILHSSYFFTFMFSTKLFLFTNVNQM